AIAQFHTPRAAAILSRRLPVEEDGAVRFRILRGLGHMRAWAPELPLDPGALRVLAERILARAFLLIAWRLALGDETSLLATLLRGKEGPAVGRLFRALGLLQPGEDLRAMHAALRGGDRARREASLEILANVLAPPLRARVLALVDDIPDAERLRRVGAGVPSLEVALAAMQVDHSVALRVVSAKLVESRAAWPSTRATCSPCAPGRRSPPLALPCSAGCAWSSSR